MGTVTVCYDPCEDGYVVSINGLPVRDNETGQPLIHRKPGPMDHEQWAAQIKRTLESIVGSR